jgi:transcriptional regulator with XRE-family HTH domain
MPASSCRRQAKESPPKDGGRRRILLREKRLAKGLSLRRFAKLAGVSPTYISQIENGHFDPPTAERVQRMADILDEPADALIARAGRVPGDLPAIIQDRPVELATFLRAAQRLTPEQLQHLINEARRMIQENGRSNRGSQTP